MASEETYGKSLAACMDLLERRGFCGVVAGRTIADLRRVSNSAPTAACLNSAPVSADRPCISRKSLALASSRRYFAGQLRNRAGPLRGAGGPGRVSLLGRSSPGAARRRVHPCLRERSALLLSR